MTSPMFDLPEHMTMGLTKDGNGPCFEGEPEFDHWGCWCGDPLCRRWQWVVKRRSPESIMSMKNSQDEAQEEADRLNAAYQTDDYIAEQFDPDKLDWPMP